MTQRSSLKEISVHFGFRNMYEVGEGVLLKLHVHQLTLCQGCDYDT